MYDTRAMQSRVVVPLILATFILSSAIAGEGSQATKSSCARVLGRQGTIASLAAPVIPAIPESNADASIRAFEASKNLSQKMRDNAPDFWSYVARRGSAYYSPKILSYHGWILGDLHPGNFIYGPLNGTMSFFVADIKDAGQGPLIADFQRLVTTTYAVNKKKTPISQTVDLMFDAYLKGVRGQELAMPRKMTKIFKTDAGEYAQMQSEYILKQIEGERFRMKPGMVERVSWEKTEPMRYKKLRASLSKAVTSAYPGAAVLDIASRPRERGGSKELVRYWALIKQKTELSIIEFKEIGAPAVAAYQKQTDTVPRYDAIRKIYWPLDDQSYRVVDVDGKEFWMRPKKTDVFRVPYKLEDEKDVQNLLDIATWEAFDYGKKHALQTKGLGYAEVLELNKESIKQSLSTFTTDYADHIKAGVREARGLQ
ncbi:MAG TPA: hypothetical protein VM432_04480 [Bdellovibrionales bacterium]|nr:hypothetical protein [Bdellovibrionales bacterium]